MKIGIIGCAGRMGQALVKEVYETEGCEIAGGTERNGSSNIGKDIGEIAGIGAVGVNITDSNEELVQASDAVIDFTTPDSTLAVAKLVSQHKKIHVIGTTGMTAEQKAQVKEFANNAPIVMAPNMSIGVNLLFALTEKVAGLLDDSYDIEILEMHHRHKKDAPSGTSLGLGEAAARGRKVSLDKVACKTRDGQIGERAVSEIGFATLRGGNVVGDHTVMFAGNGETIELTHKASSRDIYAKGAVKAVLWASDKAAGIYSMQDVVSA